MIQQFALPVPVMVDIFGDCCRNAAQAKDSLARNRLSRIGWALRCLRLRQSALYANPDRLRCPPARWLGCRQRLLQRLTMAVSPTTTRVMQTTRLHQSARHSTPLLYVASWLWVGSVQGICMGVPLARCCVRWGLLLTNSDSTSAPLAAATRLR